MTEERPNCRCGRQVHFDFHTSEWITDVGADFDATEFAATLKGAHVNPINVFAMFHQGYAYYNPKIATRHPAMHTDMLGQMLHYPMTRRAPDIDIIEEPGILLDQELLLPQNKPLPFRFESGLHQAISVEL